MKASSWILALLTSLATGEPNLASPGPRVCAPLHLQAGGEASAIIDNPLNEPCEATLRSQNLRPVTFHFNRASCLGFQVAKLTVPHEVPNGDAYLFWNCGNRELVCNFVNVTGGGGETGAVPTLVKGEMGCLTRTSALLTTVLTITDGTTTRGQTSTTVSEIMGTSFGTASTATSSFSDTSTATSTAAKLNPDVAQAITATMIVTTIITASCTSPTIARRWRM